jgi:carbamoylphosphate synthase small subunit
LKDVDPRVFTKMLRKEGRTDGSVTISLRNFVGEGIIKNYKNIEKKRNVRHIMRINIMVHLITKY